MNTFGQLRRPFLFAINFEMTEGLFVDDPVSQNEILYVVTGQGNKPADTPAHDKSGLAVFPIPQQDYQAAFDIIHAGLRRGDSFLANLTVRTPIETQLSLRDIFLRSNAPYQLFVPGKFVCFSPERFVSIVDGRLSAYPMKGTIDAAVADAEQIILGDFKETAEHSTIVDLLRNDVAMSADHVRVTRLRYIDRIQSHDRDILQVSSQIVGDLPGDYLSCLGDIIFRMLPAGSISGAPKASTLRLIRQAEKISRGYYTGVFGYFDGAALDSAVLIRYIEECDGKRFFRSGGGITAYSNPQAEYREVLTKIYLLFT